MNYFYRILAFIFLSTFLLPFDIYSQPQDDWRSNVERFAQRLVDAELMPGMGIAVTHGDSVIYADGFGVAQADKGLPVTEETMFYIASSTKALTATAVILLAERGELELDAPVTRYLPSLQFKAPASANSITIRDLLTMSEGVAGCPAVTLRTAYTGVFTYDILYELLSNCGADDSGTAFDYSNLPYNLLGMVLDPEKEHGWKDVVKREVLDPLGMDETSAMRSVLDAGRIAMPHRAEPDKGYRQIRLAKDDANLHAAGGHFTTPRDLAKYVAVHAGDGVLEGMRIFPEEPIASAQQKQVSQNRDFGPYHRYGWGYGWDLGTYEDKTIIHRFGGFTGYRSHMSLMPGAGIGVIVLINGFPPAGVDLMANYIYDRLLGRSNLEAEYDARLEKIIQSRTEFMRRLAANLAERKSRQKYHCRIP